MWWNILSRVKHRCRFTLVLYTLIFICFISQIYMAEMQPCHVICHRIAQNINQGQMSFSSKGLHSWLLPLLWLLSEFHTAFKIGYPNSQKDKATLTLQFFIIMYCKPCHFSVVLILAYLSWRNNLLKLISRENDTFSEIQTVLYSYHNAI